MGIIPSEGRKVPPWLHMALTSCTASLQGFLGSLEAARCPFSKCQWAAGFGGKSEIDLELRQATGERQDLQRTLGVSPDSHGPIWHGSHPSPVFLMQEVRSGATMSFQGAMSAAELGAPRPGWVCQVQGHQLESTLFKRRHPLGKLTLVALLSKLTPCQEAQARVPLQGGSSGYMKASLCWSAGPRPEALSSVTSRPSVSGVCPLPHM